MIQSTEKCRYKVENDSGGGKIKENGCSLCSEEYHPAVKIDFEQIHSTTVQGAVEMYNRCVRNLRRLLYGSFKAEQSKIDFWSPAPKILIY